MRLRRIPNPIWVFIFLVSHSALLAADQPSAPVQIERLTQTPANAPAIWGVAVVDVRNGQRLVGINEDHLFVPASILKIVTVLAVMKTYPLDHRFQTTILSTGPLDDAGTLAGDLIIQGGGDPSWSFEFYQDDYDKPMDVFAAALLSAFPVRTITGDIIADDTRFLYKPHGPSWSWEVFQWRYGSRVSALSLNDNIMRVQLKPSRDGQPVQITTFPSFYRPRVQCETVTSARASLEDLIAFKPFDSDIYYLAGLFPLRQSSWNLKITVSDPALFFGEWLKESLTRQGVSIRGQVRARHRTHYRGISPLTSSAEPRVAIPGQSLGDILMPTMKKSINLYAELLLRNMGADAPVAGLDETAAGIRHVYSLWPQRMEPDGNIMLADGSGLSRRNLISPALLASLLAEEHRRPPFTSFLEFFPVSGREGTIKNRLKRRLTGDVFGKTGLLEQVASMAGYVHTRSGRWLAFCIVANNHPAHKTTARSTIDAIVRVLHDSY